MKSRRRSKKREPGSVAGVPEQPPSLFRFRGLWRDEKLLVVDLADHHFPRRCLKSNLMVAALEPVTLAYSQPTLEELRLLRGRDYQQAKITIVDGSKQWTRVLIELPVPLSPGWRTIWLTPWGQRSIWIGLAVFVTAIVGIRYNEDLGLFFSLVGMLSMLFGAAFQIALRWVLPVYRVCEGKIWIGGVHRDWIARLPKFTPSRTMLEEEIWLLNASLWACFWFGVFVLGLFLGGRFSCELSGKDDNYFGYAVLTIVAAAILVGNRARMLLYTAKRQLAAMDPPAPQILRRKRRR
jgi:hypothetical protein